METQQGMLSPDAPRSDDTTETPTNQKKCPKLKGLPLLIVLAGTIIVIVLVVVLVVKRSRHPSPSNNSGSDGLDTDTTDTWDTTWDTSWDECEDPNLSQAGDRWILWQLLYTFGLTSNDTMNNGILDIQFPDDAANYEYNNNMSDSERYYTFSYIDNTYVFSLCFRNNEKVYSHSSMPFNYNTSQRSVNLREYAASILGDDGYESEISMDLWGCGDYCLDNVFYLPSRINETFPQYDYYDYPWYVYYDNSTQMCYCQGLLNGTSWYESWLWYGIINYWDVYNYSYEYNVSMDMSINGSLMDKVVNVDKMEINVELVEGYSYYKYSSLSCDVSNGDFRINYTYVEDFNISNFKYYTWCDIISVGRPYVVESENGSGNRNGNRLEANSKTIRDEECDAYENWWLLDMSNDGYRNERNTKNITTSQKIKNNDRLNTLGKKLKLGGVAETEYEYEYDLNYVAEMWYNSGLTEHGSIASFSANGIRLLSIGAPSYLLVDNYKASLDEIEHAKICFTLSHYYKTLANNDSDIEENRELKIPSGMNEHTISILGDTFDNWNKISIETAQHGAIDETLSCIISLVKGLIFDDNDNDNDFKQLLITIAYDEAIHSSFAWATLKWFKKFKSDKLDVFNHYWWKNEIDKRTRGNIKDSNNNDDDTDGLKMNKYGILSYDQEMKIKDMGLKKLVPQLINECLFDGTVNTQKEIDHDCSLQVIHAFMKNIVENGVDF